MDRQQIEQLNETASEHFKRGEFQEAVHVWRTLLAIDPSDPKALEGIRMVELLETDSDGVPDAPPSEPAAASVEAPDFEIQEELLDLASLPKPQPGAGGKPAGSNPRAIASALGALDLGPAKATARAATSAPAPAASVATLEAPGGDELLGALAGEPAAAAPPPAAVASEPGEAGQELQKRIRALLDEAWRLVAEGHREEALALLPRVFILDEENQEAKALDDELRTAIGRSTRDIEGWIAEAVQDYDAGNLAEAKTLFQQVVDKMPGHAEALHYLSRIAEEERRAASQPAAEPQTPVIDLPQASDTDGLLASGGLALSSLDGAVAAADKILTTAEPVAPRTEPRPAQFGETPAPSKPAVQLPTVSLPRFPRGLLILVAIVAVAAAALAAWWFLARGSKPAHVSLAVPRSGAPAATAPASRAAAPTRRASAPAASSAEEALRTVQSALARAKAAYDAADYGAAIVAYNEALTLDPENAQTRADLFRAGEAYKTQKAENELLSRIRAYFAEEQYAEALRLLYRLPENQRGPKAERYKVNCWYNGGLLCLKAGNCKDALSNFTEALAIAPDDAEVRRAKALAVSYREAGKDHEFFAAAESFRARKLDD